MYARGMTVRVIQGHLAELYDIDVSPDLVSAVTAILDETAEWRVRRDRGRRPRKLDERRSRPSTRWYSSTLYGSKCATRALCAARRSTPLSGFVRTAARRSSVCGSSRRRARNSGCRR